MLQSIDLTVTEQQQKDYIYIYIYLEREREIIFCTIKHIKPGIKNIATFEEGISLHGQ